MNNKTWKELLTANHRNLEPIWLNELVPTLIGESKGLGFVSLDREDNILIVGSSGAGKSVLVNQLINQIALDNSPKLVRLWLSDCKGYEFVQYLPKDGVFLPHVEVCAVTPDWRYHLQVLHELMKEANQRYETLRVAGCKKQMEYNEKSLEEHTDAYMPTLYYVCDEFQVLFEHPEAHSALQYILKVGRTVGIRLIFSSQSSVDSLTTDELCIFKTRIALRCSKHDSERLAGSDVASAILEKNGVAYIVELPFGGTCIKIELPFISDEAVSENILRLHKHCCERCPEILKIDRLFFYYKKESTLENFEKSYEDTYKGIDIPKGTLFLGDRLTFDKSKAHCNIILSKRDDMHVLACFPKPDDYASFLNTIWVNKCIQKDSDVTFITSSSGVATVRNIEGMLRQDIISSMIVRSYEAFKNHMGVFLKEAENEYSPNPKTIVLCGFEKLITSDNIAQFKELLIELGKNNIHIIMVVMNTKGIDKLEFADAFFYKICGKAKIQDSLYLLNSDEAAIDYPDTDNWAILNFAGKHMRYEYFKDNLYSSLDSLDNYQLNF